VRKDWLPVSAALLLTGALALCVGSLLLPQGDDVAQSLRIVQSQGAQWMAAAGVFFLASVCLTLGLPAILTLVQSRGWTLGMVGGIVLEVGFIGTGGYGMLLAFFHTLVVTGTLRSAGIDEISRDPGLLVFLYVWIAGFYLGELLLAIALLRAGTVPRWVPVAFLLHVLTLPVGMLLPEWASKATVLLLVLGFAGVAVQAGTQQPRVPTR
jgi:hypothetical protein